MSNPSIPRRVDITQNTPSELQIRAAIEAVELLGAHPLLTDAVVLLDQARSKLADFVDGVGVASQQTPVEKRIVDNKLLRSKAKEIELHLKASPIKSAERTLAMRAIQQAKHWLGEDLAECGATYPYPQSMNPQNTVVHPPAA